MTRQKKNLSNVINNVLIYGKQVQREKKNSDWLSERSEVCANCFFKILHKRNNLLLRRNLISILFGGQFELNSHDSYLQSFFFLKLLKSDNNGQ